MRHGKNKYDIFILRQLPAFHKYPQITHMKIKICNTILPDGDFDTKYVLESYCKT